MIELNGHLVDFKMFPNGETFADLPDKWIRNENVFHLRFESDADLLHLMWLKNTVDARMGKVPSMLFCPYFPYSRMDRAEGTRLFTLKSIASLINSLEFSSVWALEPHSDVLPALVNNFHPLSLSLFGKRTGLPLIAANDWMARQGLCEDSRFSTFEGLTHDSTSGYDFSAFYDAGIYFVYPDAGAQKRYSKEYPYSKSILCAKDRDFETGKIRGIIPVLTDDAINDCRCAIIVDDLCSGGRTFIEVAKALRQRLPNLKSVLLCVPHCENTVALNIEEVEKTVELVYTTDSIFHPDAEMKAKLSRPLFVVGKLVVPSVVNAFDGNVDIDF